MGTSVINSQTFEQIPRLPTNYHDVRIEYTNASTVTVKAGSRVRSSDDTEDIVFPTDTTVDLAVSGAGGLDTGSEASNTWYNLYAVKNPSSGVVSAVFSVTNEAVSGSFDYLNYCRLTRVA